MKITTATAKGRRPYQEDRFITHQFDDGLLIAVFDGHGGDKTSQFAVDNVVGLWQSSAGQPKTRMATLFRSLNALTKDFDAGSTASIVFIPKSNRQAIVGILGDSPVLIKNSDGELNIAPEHNVRTNGAEVDAAIRRGAVMANGYMFANRFENGLQMTRALGDKSLHSILNRLPEIYTVRLSSTKSWVLVGTDGLFDPGHASKLVITDVAANVEINLDAENLVDIALEAPTYDNVTAILIRMEKKAK